MLRTGQLVAAERVGRFQAPVMVEFSEHRLWSWRLPGFFSRPSPKAGRELQTVLNTMEGGMMSEEDP